jgi:hypothetical protein
MSTLARALACLVMFCLVANPSFAPVGPVGSVRQSSNSSVPLTQAIAPELVASYHQPLKSLPAQLNQAAKALVQAPSMSMSEEGVLTPEAMIQWIDQAQQELAEKPIEKVLSEEIHWRTNLGDEKITWMKTSLRIVPIPPLKTNAISVWIVDQYGTPLAAYHRLWDYRKGLVWIGYEKQGTESGVSVRARNPRLNESQIIKDIRQRISLHATGEWQALHITHTNWKEAMYRYLAEFSAWAWINREALGMPPPGSPIKGMVPVTTANREAMSDIRDRLSEPLGNDSLNLMASSLTRNFGWPARLLTVAEKVGLNPSPEKKPAGPKSDEEQVAASMVGQKQRKIILPLRLTGPKTPNRYEVLPGLIHHVLDLHPSYSFYDLLCELKTRIQKVLARSNPQVPSLAHDVASEGVFDILDWVVLVLRQNVPTLLSVTNLEVKLQRGDRIFIHKKVLPSQAVGSAS